MQFFRSLLCYIAYFFWIILASVSISILFFLPRKILNAISVFCCSKIVDSLKIARITIETKGLDNIPKNTKVIFAVKHQSAIETFYMRAVDDSIFVLKKELMYIPFFGWAHIALKSIPIDRANGRGVIKKMAKKCKDALNNGFNIVIFPEGTRTKPGVKSIYKPGVGLIATETNALVVPVAHNFGVFWVKHKFIKNKGVATIEFMPPIDPATMSARECSEAIQNAIENKSLELFEKAC